MFYIYLTFAIVLCALLLAIVNFFFAPDDPPPAREPDCYGGIFTQDVLVVRQCEYCYGTLEEDGTITWMCDAYHPEVLAQMDERDKRKDEEA